MKLTMVKLEIAARDTAKQRAKELGMEVVPIIQLSHLSELEKKQYILAHNKLTLETGFDEELLRIEHLPIYAFAFTTTFCITTVPSLIFALDEIILLGCIRIGVKNPFSFTFL